MSILNQIHAERESVCMGDDCNAPNAKELEYTTNELLSDLLDSVAQYVPSMKNVVWSVICKGRTIAYLIFDVNACCKYELTISDMRVSELDEKKIYCRYYYKGKLSLESYTQYETLLEKVKAYEKLY